MAENESVETPLEHNLRRYFQTAPASAADCPDTATICDWVEQEETGEGNFVPPSHLFTCPACQREYLRVRDLWRETPDPITLPLLPLPRRDAPALAADETSVSAGQTASVPLRERLRRWFAFPTPVFAGACAALACAALYSARRLSDAEGQVAALRRQAHDSEIALQTEQKNRDAERSGRLTQASNAEQAQREAEDLRRRLKQSQDALKANQKVSAAQIATVPMPTAAQIDLLAQRENSATMGDANGLGSVTTIAPTRAQLLSRAKVALRWRPFAGADSYRISLIWSDTPNPAPVFPSLKPIKATEWTPPQPLAPGRVYDWSVTALRHDKSIAVSEYQRFFVY